MENFEAYSVLKCYMNEGNEVFLHQNKETGKYSTATVVEKKISHFQVHKTKEQAQEVFLLLRDCFREVQKFPRL